MSSNGQKPVTELIDTTTVLSLLTTVAILLAAYTTSLYALARDAGTKTRVLFIWHAFDALIHFNLEGSFLYNCFFSTVNTLKIKGHGHEGSGLSEFLPPNVFFLGKKDALSGSFYGTGPTAALWREYAEADRRWGGTDLTVISLELLTVFVMGPLAVWVCVCLSRSTKSTSSSSPTRVGPEWFWMMVIATSELYGGFMTFAPEWLSGSPNLDTSNALYLWVYLFFFNMLWVWIPFWILYEAYSAITSPQAHRSSESHTKKVT